MKKNLFLLLLIMVSSSVCAQSKFDDLYYSPPKKDKKTAQTSVNKDVAETQRHQNTQNKSIGYEYFDVELGEFVYIDGDDVYLLENEDVNELNLDHSGNSVTLKIDSYKNIFDLTEGIYQVEVRNNYIYFLNSDIDGITNIYELNDGFYTVYITKSSIRFKQNND